MRLEYIVVGIVLLLIVFLVVIGLLSGVMPQADILFNLTKG